MSKVEIITEHYREWVFMEIKNEPEVFGGDSGNPAIMKQFFTKMYGSMQVRDLPIEAYSELSAVSRAKNYILEENKQYDFRVKHKPKNKKKK